MLSYDTCKNKPRAFLAVTGVTLAEFECWWPAFQAADARTYPPDLPSEGKARQRGAGGGAQGALPSCADKLLFMLGYQQPTPRPGLHGWPCALSPSPAHAWRHRFRPVLPHALRELGQAPEREAQRVETSAMALAGAPTLAVDGTARRRPRPRDAATPQDHDSGKHKPPTDQTILLSNAHTGTVGSLGPTLPGQPHAKQAVAATPVVDRSPTTRDKATGWQGDEPGGVWTTQPQKSPKAKS